MSASSSACRRSIVRVDCLIHKLAGAAKELVLVGDEGEQQADGWALQRSELNLNVMLNACGRNKLIRPMLIPRSTHIRQSRPQVKAGEQSKGPGSPCGLLLHRQGKIIMRPEHARERAEALFKRKEEAHIESNKAMAEYKARQQTLREKTARLRALRLAREMTNKLPN
jgi:hypothetical protein